MINPFSQYMKRANFILRFLLFGLLLLLLAGCASQPSGVPMNYRWASVEGGQIQETQAGEQFYFGIPVDEGMIAEGAPVSIKVSGDVISGWLRFELRAPDGESAWDSGTINPGDFSVSTKYPLPAGQVGDYTLGLVYGANTSATYNLGWRAFKLGPIILLPGLGMIAVGLAFIAYVARKRLTGWRYLGLGALFWALTVAIKFAVAIPLNPLLFRVLGADSEHLFAPGNLAAYLYIGALTGIFEVGLTWLILARVRWGRAAWNQALVFGVGFGVVEALLLGLMGITPALVAYLAPDALPVSVLGELSRNASFVMGLAPVVERLAVVFAHIFACVLIFYAIAVGEIKWGWLAILYKTVLDAVAGFANFWGVGAPVKIWTLEAVILVLGLIGLWGTWQIAQRYPRLPSEREVSQ